MHPAVRAFISESAAVLLPDNYSVLEIGALDVNGTIRDVFTYASLYVGLDIKGGPGVDIVADAAEWTPDREYDVVVSTEVLEHAPKWRDICDTAYTALKAGGWLFITCATTGRGVHNAHGAPEPLADEFYANVGLDAFADWAEEKFSWCELRKTPGADLQFRGRKKWLE